MSKLLIATRNPGKFREIRAVLESLASELVTPDDLGISEEPVEDGETFAENSLLKANFFWQRSGLPVLADDGGLEVDALGGRPGVHSRVINGKRLNDQELRDWILDQLRDVPEAKRTAKLKTVVTLRITQDRNWQAEAVHRGLIRRSDVPIDPGYPYRSIFWIPELHKFYAELTPAEHERLNHRRQAILKLLPYIQQYL
ncbi:MAG: non-canonical purine NTP pyrophosphatase [Candidatus Kerfeldbacteria bacterium]|nr:non-canonical purine NTP pyrophosphatase [Candidatus Kerfeldbacteria bacterium]